MKGKNCIVTGGNSGIGFETALALSKLGANIIIISRDQQRAENAVRSIRTISRNENVYYELADLSSNSSVKDLSTRVRSRFKSLDVLVNNAGTWLSQLKLTEDNLETQFAVNHLGYFMFTYEMMGALARSEEARIICVGSDAHFHGRIHFDDLSLKRRYHGFRAYSQSKLANVLFVYEMHRQLRVRQIDNVLINCVQPGLVKTDIGLKHTTPFQNLAWRLRRLGGVSPEMGAETSIFLASSDEVKGESGKYWDKCKPKPSSKLSYDETIASRLWDISKELCGIEDYFFHMKSSE